MVRWLVIATIIGAAECLFAPAAAAQTNCGGPYGAGFRIVSVPSGPKMAVWYPTNSTESRYSYSTDLAGSLAVNSPISTCARFPLVTFSHGLGGCGIQSVFLTEQLARAGFIVAAPDHADASCSVDGSGSLKLVGTEESLFQPERWTDQTYEVRRADISRVTSWVLTSPEFGAQVDPDRIAASGHSLGGYTALGMSGAWPSWKDTRVKAALLLSPYALPFLTDNRLTRIDIPVMYQGAQFDIAITPFVKSENGAYSQAKPPRFFLELRAGSHFEWTNAICIGVPTVAECLTRPNAKLIVDYAINFLNRYLGRDSGAVAKMDGAGLATYRRTVPLTTVISANYNSEVAPESIAASFGEALGAATLSTPSTSLPTSLGNMSISITDSAGVNRRGPLFFVSPGQVNFFVPAAVSSGTASIEVTAGSEVVAKGNVRVSNNSPSVYTADSSGRGVAAAYVLRVPQSGSRSLELIYDQKTLAAVPIDLGPATDELYLSLYGTGLRRYSDRPTATIGGMPVTVFGPVAHSIYPGLDQVNIGPIPRALAGKGSVDAIVTIDGRPTNAVTLVIR